MKFHGLRSLMTFSVKGHCSQILRSLTVDPAPSCSPTEAWPPGRHHAPVISDRNAPLSPFPHWAQTKASLVSSIHTSIPCIQQGAPWALALCQQPALICGCGACLPAAWHFLCSESKIRILPLPVCFPVVAGNEFIVCELLTWMRKIRGKGRCGGI